MAASALFILDLKGRIILSRDYRGDVAPKFAERFISRVAELEESGKLTPVIYDEGVSYAYVQYSNLYLVVVARTNINAAALITFLHKLKEVFVHYFNELEEESLRDNFVIAYELLDEVRPAVQLSCDTHPVDCWTVYTAPVVSRPPSAFYPPKHHICFQLVK